MATAVLLPTEPAPLSAGDHHHSVGPPLYQATSMLHPPVYPGPARAGIEQCFLQVRCVGSKTPFKTWQLCYVCVLKCEVTGRVVIHLLPVDHHRDVAAPPRMLLRPSGAALQKTFSKHFGFMRIAHFSLDASSMYFNRPNKPGAEAAEQIWSFAGFGLSNELDGPSMRFGKKLSGEMGWKVFGKEGEEIQL